ncbi:pyruvate kinase, partial [Caballeronia catudaia]|uniref:pyruvate kinase n=1 Tax=Caballeronia catudaia TaxID=1777136 RepID=UPI002285FAD4
MAAIRRIEARHARPIGVLLDLQGPKLRVARFRDGKVELRAGQTFSFDLDSAPGDESRVCLPHPEIFAVAAVGDTFLANDGLLRFKILALLNLEWGVPRTRASIDRCLRSFTKDEGRPF